VGNYQNLSRPKKNEGVSFICNPILKTVQGVHRQTVTPACNQLMVDHESKDALLFVGLLALRCVCTVYIQ